MELEALAADSSDVANLRAENVLLHARVNDLQAQLDWFKRQVFGERSEKRLFYDDPRQLSLGEMPNDTPPSPTESVKSYERRVRPEKTDTEAGDPLLRFDESVPVETIEVLPDEVKDLPAEAYEVVSEKISHRLAQRPAAYVVLKYVRKVVKLKSEERLVTAPVPCEVLERSFADPSLLAGILVDKFLYHLPLYRQHQRLSAAGITVSRVTLTNYVHRTVQLLTSVYYAQLSSILQSKVLMMDETPIKAGKSATPGKMQKGFYWPLYGDQQEVAFPFAASRGERVAKEILGKYCGTLVTDGYAVYHKVAEAEQAIRHAQCWVHTRRHFINAESIEPQRVKHALELIGKLYQIEDEAKDLSPDKRLALRQSRATPIVDEFFAWLKRELSTQVLLPSSLFTKAAAYALERERALRVFLEDGAVPLDTNALERALRPIPMGRKNWLFCWTEVGAEYVGMIQSLLVTCKLHEIDPFTYLVDVSQRIGSHPAREVHLLTPRLWKEHFAAAPIGCHVLRG